ncbi:hypothetical protein SL053_002153 [Flavobacterium psychrophilum]|uniref:hypothetical protein n=1 Tax=Flavobacterium psychrophilum TaxID=96345 RepID=UPI001D06CF46|nr:hypothetical protein [Flavobacterium psychrophilum]ELV7526251.1 hypothetical protein [Flavobacterium psychrophilum]ELY2018235.1 hypothetical protein [Flavobacterium psychrophilum]MCB6099627.1 hypothetical protein [Flavobacterium psychrophilum]
MKYINNLILLSTFIFLCCSCGIGDWETTLYCQKIEGTSKILYKYDAWGGRDSHAFGYILLDSTENFEVDISKNLAFSYLENIPNKKLIQGVEFEQPTSENSKVFFTPIKESNMSENGIEIKTKLFQYYGYKQKGGRLGTFEFENFKESRDSLIFYNLNDVKSMEPHHLDTLKLKKKDIVIRQNKNLEIISIDIEDINVSKTTNEIISHNTYFLTPKKRMKSNLFSDYGIFKERI